MTNRHKSQIVWTLLLVGPILTWVIGFAVFEFLGLTNEDAADGWITLSRYSWEISQSWPLFFPIVFYLIGSIQWGFAVHVLWRWNPNDPNDHKG